MADYRRKKRNLNKVDFSNKTKNQSRRYLINQFESLGIKVPNYVNNPTRGNINKALRRINKEIDKIIERQKIESVERKALNRDTDTQLNKGLKSYNAQITRTLNQIKAYYPELSNTIINFIKGEEVTIPGFNRSFYLDNNLKKINKDSLRFSTKQAKIEFIQNLKKERKNLTFKNFMSNLTNKKKNNDYFESLISMTEGVLTEQDIKYLKNNFINLNGIQQIFAIKGFQQLKIDKYLEQVNSQSIKHVSLFNKINNVISNVSEV